MPPQNTVPKTPPARAAAKKLSARGFANLPLFDFPAIIPRQFAQPKDEDRHTDSESESPSPTSTTSSYTRAELERPPKPPHPHSLSAPYFNPDNDSLLPSSPIRPEPTLSFRPFPDAPKKRKTWCEKWYEKEMAKRGAREELERKGDYGLGDVVLNFPRGGVVERRGGVGEKDVRGGKGSRKGGSGGGKEVGKVGRAKSTSGSSSGAKSGVKRKVKRREGGEANKRRYVWKDPKTKNKGKKKEDGGEDPDETEVEEDVESV